MSDLVGGRIQELERSAKTEMVSIGIIGAVILQVGGLAMGHFISSAGHTGFGIGTLVALGMGLKEDEVVGRSFGVGVTFLLVMQAIAFAAFHHWMDNGVLGLALMTALLFMLSLVPDDPS